MSGTEVRGSDIGDVTVVIPTVCRPSLQRLLDSLAVQDPLPAAVLLVDDRRSPRGIPPTRIPPTRILPAPIPPTPIPPTPIPLTAAPILGPRIRWLTSEGRGPAAARNVGWRAARTAWVAFLDDDVIVPNDWVAWLAKDVSGCDPEVAGVQGRVTVPLPESPLTDFQRQVAGLESAVWATADMVVRRSALASVGGFDERFRMAYREDADLALRLQEAGWQLQRGGRRVVHPVPATDPLVSVRRQAGNAYDPLMRALHGRNWRARAHAPPGRRRRHLAVTASLATAVAALLAGSRAPAAAAAALWGIGTAEFAAARIAPGPRDRGEVGSMVVTSVLIPPVATAYWLAGWARILGGAARQPEPAARVDGERSDSLGGDRADRAGPVAIRSRARAVLLDRDGTLLADRPHNGDPDQVMAMPGAHEALRALRAAGVPTGVVSNQSGVGRGLLTSEQVDAVNRRMETVLGPLGPIVVCPHAPDDGCGCRKPRPGLVLEAARRLGVEPADCVVVGDIGSDVAAAQAAGARGVLIPTTVTRAQEIAEAPVVAESLLRAVQLILAGAV